MRLRAGRLRLVVPGLAVSRYLVPAAEELTARGFAVDLRPVPGQPPYPADRPAFGERLAEDQGPGAPGCGAGRGIGRLQLTWTQMLAVGKPASLWTELPDRVLAFLATTAMTRATLNGTAAASDDSGAGH